MWLENNDLRLNLVKAEADPELRQLQDQLPEWYNLSEKVWYAENMPDRMTFKIIYRDKAVGAAELVNIRWYNHKSEVRIWLLPEARGKGLGKAALKMLMDLAFNTLNFHRLEAEVYSFNTQSLKLIEQLRFRKEGVLREAKFFNGQYHDILRFGILRQEYLNLKSANE